nr:two pore calcium channel protein 1A-like [Ipomoea trifida]
MVTLFNLLVMGNWQSWMQSYKELTGTAWSYVYFISFYVITVLWLLNLIIAFVLEAFQTEMDLETTAMYVDGENKEERERERCRKYGTKTRSQRVDALLHHMLSSELTQCSSP